MLLCSVLSLFRRGSERHQAQDASPGSVSSALGPLFGPSGAAGRVAQPPRRSFGRAGRPRLAAPPRRLPQRAHARPSGRVCAPSAAPARPGPQPPSHAPPRPPASPSAARDARPRKQPYCMASRSPLFRRGASGVGSQVPGPSSISIRFGSRSISGRVVPHRLLFGTGRKGRRQTRNRCRVETRACPTGKRRRKCNRKPILKRSLAKVASRKHCGKSGAHFLGNL